jgi:rhodanese-related sulfurtransferase
MRQKKHRSGIIRASLLLAVLLVFTGGCGGAVQGIPTTLPEPVASVAPAAASSAGQAVYRRITAEEAKKMMDAGGVIVVDVRTPEEFAEGHIEDAVLLTDSDIPAKAVEVLPDKAATILVYCRSGRRSELAAQKLVEMGYTGIHDFGGILDWPFEVVK